VVSVGNATIQTEGADMVVHQTTQKAAIQWDNFDIGQNASVHFKQPNADAVALNRVLSQNPSQIHGKLRANGQVFLLNPNGVIFGPTAQVNVGGLVASTMQLSDDDFLVGRYQFHAENASSIVQGGHVAAHYVALLAPEVRNEGVITAQLGTVALASGDVITLTLEDYSHLQVQVEPSTFRSWIENKSALIAEGGTVILSASAANALLSEVIGITSVSGLIDVSSEHGSGGTITVTGQEICISEEAILNASASQECKGGQI
jgi:filamentous hemagglutinin family protein